VNCHRTTKTDVLFPAPYTTTLRCLIVLECFQREDIQNLREEVLFEETSGTFELACHRHRVRKGCIKQVQQSTRLSREPEEDHQTLTESPSKIHRTTIKFPQKDHHKSIEDHQIFTERPPHIHKKLTNNYPQDDHIIMFFANLN
jgi:hypothetical protein